MTINLVTLVGRAGRDPEIRYFENGTSLCKVTLAVNRMKKNEPPDWFDLEFWDKTAQIATDYVRKGSLIGVQGSLKIDTWSDRTTGTQRSKPIIRVSRLELLGSKQDNDASNVPKSQEYEF